MLYSVCVRVPAAVPADPGGGTDDSWRSTIALDKRSAKSFIRINDRIRAREIRVIDENGEQLGILPPYEALKIARERGLDLVEGFAQRSSSGLPYSGLRSLPLREGKSERAARKKQKIITLKEVKFSVTVDEHDYQTKKNQAVRSLGDGDKVKASLRFRGRQMAHRELGYNIINRLIQDIGDAGMVEFMPPHGRHDSSRYPCAVQEAGSSQAQAACGAAASGSRPRPLRARSHPRRSKNRNPAGSRPSADGSRVYPPPPPPSRPGRKARVCCSHAFSRFLTFPLPAPLCLVGVHVVGVRCGSAIRSHQPPLSRERRASPP